MLIKKNEKKSAEICADFLLGNELVILPTDTVYGFSGLNNSEVEKKLYAVKGREKEKKFISLISAPEEVLPFIKIPKFKNFLSLWSIPYPLTLIFENSAGSGTIAFRYPHSLWLQSVLCKIKKPVFSTSVNYSGKHLMTDISVISKEFEDKVSLIVDGGKLENEVSSIIDLSGEKPEIVRKGRAALNLFAILQG